MGKSSKKSNVAAVPVAVPSPVKSAKKGKRDAEKAIEKPASAKKQKVEVAVVPKQKEKENKKAKKAKKAPPLKVQPETSSSEEDSSSEEEDTKTKAAVIPKKAPANGAKKQESSDSSDSDSSSDEEPNPKALAAAKKLPAKGIQNGNAVASKKKQESSDSSSDSEEETVNVKKTAASIKPSAAVAKKKEESSDGSSESDSDEDDEMNVKDATPAKSLLATSKAAPNNEAKKKEESSDSSESDSGSDEDDEKDSAPKVSGKLNVKPDTDDNSSDEDEDDSSEESSDGEPSKIPQNKTPKASKKSSSEEESSEDSEDEDESEDEQMNLPKKEKDVIMKDAPASAATKGSEKKGLQTPASNQSQNSGSKTLFVGNLSYDIGEDDVVEFFKKAGEVVDVRLAKDDEGRFKGFGHVEFVSEEVSQKAYEMNGQDLLGRGVRLDFARERGAYTPQSGKENSSFQKGGKGQSHTIFVRGFDKSIEMNQIENNLKEHFGSCGEITRVSLPKDYETGASKGIAYMDFNDQDAFSKALELNGSELGDYALTVEEAKPRGDSRDGGGWSGGRGGRDGGGRSGGRFGGGRRGGRGGGRDGGGRGGFGGRGRGGGRGGRGRQSAGTPSSGKKTTFGDD